MIIPMKKITVLCLEQDQHETLNTLHQLGIMHLAHIQPPVGEDIDAAKIRVEQTNRVIDRLKKFEEAKDYTPLDYTTDEILEKVTALTEIRKENKLRIEALHAEEKRIQDFGSFEPSLIEELAQHGVQIELYQLSLKDRLELPEGAASYLIQSTKAGRYMAVISQQEVELSYAPFRLPDRSLKSIQQKIEDLKERKNQIDEKLLVFRPALPQIQEHLLELEDQFEYLKVQKGMGADSALVYLQGYVPVDQVSSLQSAAEQHGWGLLINDPSANDPVPTAIKHPAWIKPIKAIFDLTGIIPGYDEVDISPIFLLAMTIFFAMLVGDAGYGALFLVLTFLLRKKLSKAPNYPFRFMYIMSVSTMVWGALTGTYFGVTKSLITLPYSSWLNDDSHVMYLCFLIGATHLSIAHLWNAWLLRKSPQALAHIGWVCSTWTMFYLAGMFVLGQQPAPWVWGMFAAGFALIVLFMTPLKLLKAEWFNHVMLPLTVINNFTDVVSYLRLFAVGTASFAVANAFNQMLLGEGWSPSVAGLISAILLFAGHALNIALCGLGILVHGVRLNTLEYSAHMGLQWKGHQYKPFKKKVVEG